MSLSATGSKKAPNVEISFCRRQLTHMGGQQTSCSCHLRHAVQYTEHTLICFK